MTSTNDIEDAHEREAERMHRRARGQGVGSMAATPVRVVPTRVREVEDSRGVRA